MSSNPTSAVRSNHLCKEVEGARFQLQPWKMDELILPFI